MFKVIEDASVPRGTVRFYPEPSYVLQNLGTMRETIHYTTNVYVNPQDFSLRRPVFNFPYRLTVDGSGTLYLAAT